jgi:L-alanine-DL-glutamate epimerase-like enolase superfamily enzyme
MGVFPYDLGNRYPRTSIPRFFAATSKHPDRVDTLSYSSWTLRYDSQGSLFVKVTADDGTVGYATGFGGPPACWLIEEHFKRFVVGQDPRNTNVMWEQVSVAD